MSNRRDFLRHASFAATGYALPIRAGRSTPGTFVDLRRAPDVVAIQTARSIQRLTPAGSDRWQAAALTVRATHADGATRFTLEAPNDAVRRVHLRWRADLATVRLVLGDAWERGYGDLAWRGFEPDRVLPWYVATTDGAHTHVYGVRTGAASLCFWQVDPAGLTLWADVRAGGVGVQLGARPLAFADVVARAGMPSETPFAALRAACRSMCPRPVLPREPVYGHNDWYYAYGKNSADSIRADAARIVDLAPTGANRPYVVIDDGWQPERSDAKGDVANAGRGEWDRGNEKFRDMARLAADVRTAGARPGVWTRPLLAPNDAPDAWRLARDRTVLDPTVPDVLHKVAADVARLREWGYALIKHDYSTFDLFGRWGFQMGSAITREGWTFAAGPTRTSAEVIDALYATIRDAARDALVIGCNTVSHLSAGRFEMCRVGDDTSGTEWARTRKMGVNTLAFRAAQHGAFYVADPDCVGVTTDIPWADNRQWLDLLARSGTMLFVSLAPNALGADQRRDVRAALALAAQPQPLGEPLDWMRTSFPSRWRFGRDTQRYDWMDASGEVVPPS